MPKISIIIPVYNVERYLRECIDSVLAQNFADFECLLIDDGSSDGSGAICDDYARRDPRFRVFHQPNSGVSAARNLGLSLAQGEYLAFIDSDDTVDPDYLGGLLKNMQDSDLSICGLSRTRHGIRKTLLPPDGNHKTLTDQNNGYFAALLESYSLYGPVCKLYRLSIIKENHIIFPVGISYGEDLIFNFHYLERCASISSQTISLYNYMVHENSLSTSYRHDFWKINSSQWLIVRSFFEKKKMMSGEIAATLYRRLAGIVYDAVFQATEAKIPLARKRKLLKDVFSFAHINTDGFHEALRRFNCSDWIKISIRNHLTIPFLIKSII